MSVSHEASVKPTPWCSTVWMMLEDTSCGLEGSLVVGLCLQSPGHGWLQWTHSCVDVRGETCASNNGSHLRDLET